MKPYGHKIGADSNWGVGKQLNAIKGRERFSARCNIHTERIDMANETRGRKPLSFANKLANVPLRIYPREADAIKLLAEREGISAMAWKQRAIRSCLPPAGSP